MIKGILKYEIKRRLRLHYIIMFSILAIVLLFVVHHGKQRYLETLDNVKICQNDETKRVEQYVLYRQYGAYGINLFFVPSPYSILYFDCRFSSLTGHINTGDKLSIHSSMKGRDFLTGSSSTLSFSTLSIIFGIAFALLYGVGVRPPHFWLTAFSRLLLINTATVVLALLCFAYPLVSGVNLFQSPTISLLIALLAMITTYFTIGCVIGRLNAASIRSLALGIVYIVSVLIVVMLPSAINAGDIEASAVFNSQSFQTIMKIDRELIEKYGSLTGPPSKDFVNAVLDAIDNEHASVRKREMGLKVKVLKKIEQTHTLSALFPALHFYSLNKEISSHGGINYINFHSFSIQRKKEFIDFYVRRRFLSNQGKPGPIENFVKANEDRFQGQSIIPENGVGLLMAFIWILLLSLFIMYRIHRANNPPRLSNENEEKLKAEYTGLTAVITKIPTAKLRLAARLKFEGITFRCVPSPGELDDDVKLKDLFELHAVPVPTALEDIKNYPIERLDTDQKAAAIIAILRGQEYQAYIFDDFMYGLTSDKLFAAYLEENKEKTIYYLSPSLAALHQLPVNKAIELK